VYFSPGDSSVVILAPKREGKGLKTPPTSSSSTKKQVTRKNPDPKPVAAVSDPEKLLRKSKNTPGQSSLSKEKFSSTSTQGQSSETVNILPIEEIIPESETKPIVEPSVSFPSTISELNLDQWKLFVELIEEEQTNTLSIAEALRDFPKDIKSEPDTLSSSPQSSSSEENKPHYYSFENPLFLEPSTYSGSDKKPLISLVEDQKLISAQLSCSTQGTVSLSTSPVLLTPTVQTPIVINMVVNRMDAIVAARYAPLNLPQVLYAFPPNDYMKYFPRFNGEGEVTAEEHLNSFYSFADNFNVEHADVWMRLFVQSLDGEARKWFRSLPPNSIVDIDALDDTFLRHWGDKKDYLYYITEFGALKRKQGESISDFTKRFNKMYSKIPDEIKPTETSAKITFSNAFDAEFSLLLRERRSATLILMQEATIEVESNILATEKLKSRGDRDRKKQREELPSSSHTTSDSKMDEMAKMLKTLTSEMARLKMETKQPSRPTQEGGYINPNQFRRPNNVLKFFPEKGEIKKIIKFCLLFKIMQWKKLKKLMTLKKILQCI
jgi:hypothetical protein